MTDILNALRDEIRSALGNRIPADRPVALIDFPDSFNCGDLAIWHGEKAYLRSLGIVPVYECSMQSYDERLLRDALGRDGIVLLHGGGNFGDLYVYHQFRERVLHDFPAHDALLFPHTVKFFDPLALRHSAEFYNRRRRITLCARDRTSRTLLEKHFGLCEVLLVPDMAFMLGPQQRTQPATEDVLWLARTDGESRFDKGRGIRGTAGNASGVMELRIDGVPAVASLAVHRSAGALVTDWYELGFSDETRAEAYRRLSFDDKAAVQFAWAKAILSLGRVVVTDRLHAHIICELLGIPHVLVENSYGKLQWFVDTWTRGSPLVRFARTPEEAMRMAMELTRMGAHDRPRSTEIRQLVQSVTASRLTYLSEPRLDAIAQTCLALESAAVPGIFVETGCALGGSAIVIGKCKSADRRLKVFDVFGTIPAPSDRDGADVHERYRQIADGRAAGIGGDAYYGYEPDLLRRVRENLTRFGLAPDACAIEFFQGLFEQTLHIDEPVAFAHIDCDWYDPVLTCLERIAPRLSVGGVLLIDDYSDWSGCRQAADDYFLGKTGQFDIEKLPSGPLRVTRQSAAPTADGHWANPAALSPSWAHRAREVAGFIRAGRRVLDLGCGAMDLEKCLPPGCLYIPCDCVARDQRTLVCNFDTDELPAVSGVDLVTVLGVCEYLADLPDFFRRLRSYGVPVVLSYVPYDPDRMSLEQRDALRWTTHLTQQQWCLALERAGFRVEVLKPLDQDPSQYLFRVH